MRDLFQFDLLWVSVLQSFLGLFRPVLSVCLSPGLKLERKKLRADKNDLLSQVKQLCSSLQDKEQELRNFIRNYEQRIRESESNSAKQSTERERERWSLLKHARDEAERSIALAAQLNARDLQLQRTQEQLQEARRQLSGCMSDQESLVSAAPLTPPSGLMAHNAVAPASTPGVGYSNISGTPGDRGSCSADSGVRGKCLVSFPHTVVDECCLIKHQTLLQGVATARVPPVISI